MTESELKILKPFENIDAAIKSYSDKIKINYGWLEQRQTRFDEIDIKRFETKQCVVFGLGISAIVMVSITLEECLKTLLKAHYFYGRHDKSEELILEKWGATSNEAEDTYGAFQFNTVIEKSRKENIITEDEKTFMIHIKNTIRNSYVHSDKSKMFDNKVKTNVDVLKMVNGELKIVDNSMMNILQLNIVQGIVQKMNADKESYKIVEQIDKVICDICDRFWKTHPPK